jgi:hypothetical protein
MNIRPTVFVLAALLCPGIARADAPLFADDTVMKLSIALDFNDLCRPRESEDCEFAATVLVYGGESGKKHSMPIEIKARGGWRSLKRNCSAPPLWVRFDQDHVAGTPFEGQSVLPLTTHCGKGASLESMNLGIRRVDFEQYLLREFLAYRIYNVLTDLSLRTRLVRISYPDPKRPSRSALHYAFFTEHFDAAAARTGNERLERGSFDPERLDAQSAARVALFQFMIGNSDWSIVRERNTMLLQTGQGEQIPVPYDLDMSGLVDAAYAGPPPGLPIDDVRERYFLGHCQPGVDCNALFTDFIAKRGRILELNDRLPGLSRNSRRSAKRYLELFYATLASDDGRSKHITEACHPWPPSPVDHTTPLDE